MYQKYLNSEANKVTATSVISGYNQFPLFASLETASWFNQSFLFIIISDSLILKEAQKNHVITINGQWLWLWTGDINYVYWYILHSVSKKPPWWFSGCLGILQWIYILMIVWFQLVFYSLHMWVQHIAMEK